MSRSERNAMFNKEMDEHSVNELNPNLHNKNSEEIFNKEEILKVQREAEILLNNYNEKEISNNNLMFEKQKVSLFRLYIHLFEPIDYLFLVLALIGGICSGICQPLLFYLNSDIYSNIGNTSERPITGPPHIVEMIKEQRRQSIHKTQNKSIKKQVIFGSAAFIANFLSGTFWMLIGSRCTFNLKRRYFSLLLAQEQGWFDSFNTYELSTKVQSQLEQIENAIGIKVGLTLSSIIQLLVGYIFAFLCCWKCALVMICMLPFVLILYILLNIWLSKGIVLSRKIWENAGGIAEELIYNIKTVASFANFEYELKRFYEKVEIVYRIDLMNACRLSFTNGFIIFLSFCVVAICYIYGRTLIGKEKNFLKGRDVDGSDIFVTALCIMVGLQTINIIAPNIKGIQESCSSSSDYFHLYYRKPLMNYEQSIEKPPPEQIKGNIEFRGVNFSYPSDKNKKLILKDFNLNIMAGKKIAIVGESGCGKSTIVNLIERLYDIKDGQIVIDGLEIDKYDIKYLRNYIGYVHQEPFLFNQSIKKNIIFGREEYLTTLGNIDELVKNACEETYASEFINKLEEGLDYVVGIKGSKLSGGQKQRIAIARAIIGKPKILILDEATSSLDNISEKEVQKSLDNISKHNITTIIIAHRLSAIKNADLIYVIKDGKVEEQGTHEELINKGSYYSSLFMTQMAQDKIEKENIIDNKMNEKLILLEKNSIPNKEEKKKFEIRDNAIALSDKEIPIKPCTIVRELSNYKWDIFLGCTGALISGCLWPVSGYFNAKTINALNSKYQSRRYSEGLKYSFTFLAFAFLQGFSHCLMSWKLMSLGYSLSRIYRKKLMAKYLSFHLSYFDVTKNSPGSLLTKMAINTIELNIMLNTILGISIHCIALIIVAFIIGCKFEYRLFLINICFSPIVILSSFLRRLLIESQSRRSIDFNVKAGGILSECVINTKTIFSFNFQQRAIDMYTEVIDYIRRQFIKDSIIHGFFLGLGVCAYFMASVAIYAASKEYLSNFSLDSENMSIIMNITSTTLQELAFIIQDLGNIPKAIVAFRAIYSTLYTISLIPPFQSDNISKTSANNIKGKIELRNVYFSYPTRPDNIILKNVSLTIMPGQKIGLVGASGSGKSTIIQLICRFYDLEEGKGEIFIDDVNIKDYNLYELRKKIGLVSQEPSLFRISLIDNVRYGKLDASNEECLNAAKEADIMKIFDENKNRDKTEELNRDISNYGKKANNDILISGGEKQRLSLARIFIKNPPILLLDEVTSSLDKKAAVEIQKSLDKLANDKTSVTVAHNLRAIENCDKIFVMENGHIIEQGTHKELIAQKNVYYSLYKYSCS